MAKVTLKSKFKSGSYADHWARELMKEGQLPVLEFVKRGKRRIAVEGLKEAGKKLHEVYDVSFDDKDGICISFDDEKSKTFFLLKYSD